MTPVLRKAFIISGIVQGVGYRDFVRAAAQRDQVVGFARNLPDGRVEVVAEGGTQALSRFQRELERGPAASRVDHVAESTPAVTETFTIFNIRG